jgi:outer membrane protein with beta-barrel domain
MLKRIIVILPLFIWLHTAVVAQDVVGCTHLLDDAREAYKAGMVELVPELLLPCIESGLSGSAKTEAYKLVINAYLFDYLPDEAATMMVTFLEENPNYQAQSADPEEFKQLLEAHKLEREEAAAAAIAEVRARQIEEQEALRNAEEERKQARRGPSTSILNTEKPRIGFVLGATGSKGVLTEPYSIADPLQDEGTFSMAPGLLIGAKVDLPLSMPVEIGLGLYYNRVNLAYSAVPFDFTSYEYHECQNRIQLPISMAVYLNPSAQIRAYFRLGVVTDYLISASAYGSRTYNGTGAYLRDVELEKASITDTRSRMNMHGLLGAGVMIPLQSSFFFVELTYTAGLFQANLEDERYDSQDIVWILYHVDSNFRINQLGLNFGLSWNLN